MSSVISLEPQSPFTPKKKSGETLSSQGWLAGNSVTAPAVTESMQAHSSRKEAHLPNPWFAMRGSESAFLLSLNDLFSFLIKKNHLWKSSWPYILLFHFAPFIFSSSSHLPGSQFHPTPSAWVWVCCALCPKFLSCFPQLGSRPAQSLHPATLWWLSHYSEGSSMGPLSSVIIIPEILAMLVS